MRNRKESAGPIADAMTGREGSPVRAARCLRCGGSLQGTSFGCPSCGQSLQGTRLYDPKRFILLAVLLSGVVPIYLAASNWGRIGECRRKRLWLALGLSGYVVVFLGATLLPASLPPLASTALVFLVNVPVAALLRDQQRSLYANALAMGATPASTFFGTVRACGVLVAVLGLAVAGSFAQYNLKVELATAHVAAGRYEEAAQLYESLLSQDPEADDLVYNLALSHLYLNHWKEAAEGFGSYARKHPDDAETQALLGKALLELGRRSEAEHHFAVAEELEPQVLARLFGDP